MHCTDFTHDPHNSGSFPKETPPCEVRPILSCSLLHTIMSMSNIDIEVVKTYLGKVSLAERASFVEALNVCGSILGIWGIGYLSWNKLVHFSSKKARSSASIDFDIPKKTHGVRHISSPVKELKHIQQALNIFLQANCEVSPAAMGSSPGVPSPLMPVNTSVAA